VGYIEVTLADMFRLIHNVVENNPEMDTSLVEDEIVALTKRIYEGIPREEGSSPAQDMVDRGALDT